MLLEAIIGTIVQINADAARERLGRHETAIRLRKKLKRFGLEGEPAADDFRAIYTHALVEWGVFKPEPLLNFFRDERIYHAFEDAFQRNDPAILEKETADWLQWAEERDALGGLEYNPRLELAEFTAIFDLIVGRTRAPAEVRRDQSLEQLHRKVDEIQQAIAALVNAGVSDTPAGDTKVDEVQRAIATLLNAGVSGTPTGNTVTLSGTYSHVIINLLSTLTNVQQQIGTMPAVYEPPPLPDPDQLAEPDDLPSGSYLPFRRNPLFTGREKELIRLAKAFLYSADSRDVVITTTGIGGVGKTQLAIEFAHRYGRFFPGGVYWVSFAQEEQGGGGAEGQGGGGAEGQGSRGESLSLPVSQSLSESEMLSRIALSGAGMGLHPQYGELPVEQQAGLVQAAWAQPISRLLVFDNCEAEALLQAWRPSSGGGRILVTARRQQWDPELGLTALRLNVLDEAESTALLRRYLGKDRRAGDEDGLKAIANALGRLPLALRLAGSYLARYSRISLASYLEALQRPDLLDHFSLQGLWQTTSATAHEQHVGRTFALSFDRLQPEGSETDRLAVALLARAACFAPGEPLPTELLLATVAAPDDNPLLLDDALARLLELGLLEPSGEANEAVRLHRLLVAFVRNAVADETAQTGVEQAVFRKANNQLFEGLPAAIRAWDIHLRHVVEAAFDHEDEAAADLCGAMGSYLHMSGDLKAALPYSQQSLAIRERVLGPDHPDTAQSLNNLGALLQAQGDLAGARPYFEQALAIKERVLGGDHPDTARSLNNLGGLLQAQGDLAGARPYYEQALAIRERVLGGDHPDTAQSLNNFGYLLQAQGDLAGARPYYEQALAIHERVLGRDHPDTATSLNNLGYLLQAQGDLAGARPYYEQALAICERVLGRDHPDTALSLNNLGALLRAQGDLAGARPYYEQALAIRERVLGRDHPDTAQSLNNLGYLLRAQGDLAGARPYYEQALAIRERVLGRDHPDTAQSLNNLGYLLRAQGDLAGARPYYEQALAIRERVLGGDHPDVAYSLNNLGLLVAAEGERATAKAYLQHAVAILETKLGPDHPNTRTVRANLGGL